MNTLTINEPNVIGLSKEAKELRSRLAGLKRYLFKGSKAMRQMEHSALQKLFYAYRSEWIEATKYSSSMQLAALHPAYRKIIQLGKDVVPLLINDMRSTGTHWFIALEVITGEDPIHDDHVGDIQSMINDWLVWFKANA